MFIRQNFAQSRGKVNLNLENIELKLMTCEIF